MAGSSKKVIFAALVGNGLIAVTKFAAAAYTGSSAMLSEGIHSVVDTGNQGLLLYGLRRAKAPADAVHPFGHGKEIYFWSFVVALLIFAVGAGVSIYEGVHHILHPSAVTDPLINYVVLGAALVFEAGAWYVAFREFNRAKGERGFFRAVRRGKDPALFVVLFEDSAAMLGILIALAGITLAQITGLAVFDGIASVMIGLVLAGTAAWLAYETKGLLIGESAAPDVVDGIRALAREQPAIADAKEVLTLHMGPRFVLANVSVRFATGLSTGAIERTAAELDRRIKADYPDVKRVFIEAEAGA